MARQTYMLYASQLLQMLFGALAYILLSANLSKETFGDREIVVRLTTFFLSFFELGFFFQGRGSWLINVKRQRKENWFQH